MTAAFVVLGSCHTVTACGLRRPVQAIGGLATVLIAFAPQPARGSSDLHLALAAVGLTALAVWPLQDGRGGRIAAAVLIALLALFASALWSATAVGLTERVLIGAEALWPIMAVRTLSHQAGTTHGTR